MPVGAPGRESGRAAAGGAQGSRAGDGVGLKVALAGLLTRLHRAVVDGAAPESVFAEQVRALGLGGIERERLREELAGLGQPVLGVVAHADGDGSNAEKVARFREEIVSSPAFPSGGVVRVLLGRYVDAEGCDAARPRRCGPVGRTRRAGRGGPAGRGTDSGRAIATAEVGAGGAAQGGGGQKSGSRLDGR